MRGRLPKATVAVLLALGAAQAEVALACRRPAAEGVTSERCVWARAYLPLGRVAYVLLGAPLAYGGWSRWPGAAAPGAILAGARGRPPRRVAPCSR